MKISTSYTPESFIDLNKTITKKKFSINLYIILLSTFTAFNVLFQYFYNKNPAYIALIPVIILFVIIFLLKRRIKKNILKIYNETPRLSESINFEILENGLTISGKSFQSELKWNEVHKITFTKNWILIWQNSLAANGINMVDATPEFIEKLKEMIKLHLIKSKFDN